MVGERDPRGTELGRTAAQAVDSAGSVQERVFRVNVKMDELIQAGFL